MATELTEAQLLQKISDIDTQIATIVAAPGTYIRSYTMGNKTVDKTMLLKELREMRQVYQDQLDGIPKVVTNDHGYDVDQDTGEDKTEFIGDE